MKNVLLRSLLPALLCVVMIGHSAYAVDLWSEDLWTTPSGEKTPVTEPAPPTPTAPPDTKDTPPSGKPTGSGLWSEDLWKEPGKQGSAPVDADPPVDPAVPNGPPAAPTKPEPAGDDSGLADREYAVVMQVENTKALVRGVEHDLPVPPTIINGRMMVPLRFIGEALNAGFAWSAAERKITMELDGKRIELWVGGQTATVDGAAVQLDTPPVILNSSTLVPVRFVSENFGYELKYDPATRTVRIKAADSGEVQPGEPVPTNPEPVKPEPAEPEPTKPKPTEPKPADADPAIETPEPEKEKPVLTSTYDYFGTWTLKDGDVWMGTLTVNEDGTYSITVGPLDTVTGTWRQGEKNEIPRQDDMLILIDGPDDMDWAMVPKWPGSVSVRYHYLRSYTGTNKIWFEYSGGVKNYQ